MIWTKLTRTDAVFSRATSAVLFCAGFWIFRYAGKIPKKYPLVKGHQPRRRQSPPTVKGLPLGGSRDLPPPGGRIPGRRCTPPTSPMTHGRTSTTREQEAPRDRSRRAQLRPKA